MLKFHWFWKSLQTVSVVLVFCMIHGGMISSNPAFAKGIRPRPGSVFSKTRLRDKDAGKNSIFYGGWVSAGFTVSGKDDGSEDLNTVRRYPLNGTGLTSRKPAPTTRVLADEDIGEGTRQALDHEDGKDTSPQIGGYLGWLFARNLAGVASLNYSSDLGISDLNAGVLYNRPFGKERSFNTAASLSIPLSEQSRDDKKLTRLNLFAGPEYEMGRFNYELMGRVAYSLYGSEEAAAADGNADEEAPEILVIGAQAEIKYRYLKNIYFAAELELNKASHKDGPDTFETEVTFIKGIYSKSHYIFYASLIGVHEGEGISGPSVFNLFVGLEYSH